MQKVSPQFHKIARGSIVPLAWNLSMSFNKSRRQDVRWFTLGQSALNGGHLLATEDNNPTQVWDAYDYQDISDRAIGIDVERSVAFPYSVQSSILDITLDNHDGYLTHGNANSAIGDKILPRRPVRASLGVVGGGVVPVFVGTTQGMPKYSEDETTMRWTALDFLSEIAEQNLRSTIKLRDARTDEVIALILQQYGLTPSQYSLAPGSNTIPFVIFTKDDTAGSVLRKLVQAEGGALWLNESGIIKFSNRSGVLGVMPSMIFDETNIIQIEPSRYDGIINRVKIKSEVRKVQSSQIVFSAENENGFSSPADQDGWRVAPNSSRTAWLTLDDPVWEAIEPAINAPQSTSRLEVRDLSGNPVVAGVSTEGVLFQTSYKLTITNSNPFAVSVSLVELWGQPAKVVDVIDYEAYDDVSRDKYGDRPLIIEDNHFFGSYRNCDIFAEDILKRYSSYTPTVEMDVKGDPSLQLGDVVTINCRGVSGDYLITGIKTSLSKGRLATKITARKHEVVSPFVLNLSMLNSNDRLG